MSKPKLYPLILSPTIKNYIWGGKKLSHLLDENEIVKPEQVAEIWAIFGENKIKNGDLAGVQLNDLVHDRSIELIGNSVNNHQMVEFPLLIKILDCQEWLSIQVHPDDIQANLLENSNARGKTEAWFCLDSEPKSKIYAGSKLGVSTQDLTESIRNNRILEAIELHEMNKNDHIMINAGVIHALGPGLTIYELQQNSNVTYRVFDWNRPATAGRALHIEKSCHAVKNLQTSPRHIFSEGKSNSFEILETCPYFKLALIKNQASMLDMETNKNTFHALTVVTGEISVQFENSKFSLKQYESILIPACLSAYQLSGDFSVLLATIN